MRKVQIENKKLEDILGKRAKLHKEIGVQNEIIIKADKERTKLGYKMNKLKEKTKSIMDKIDKPLEEFEIISRVYMEDGKAYYEVLNQVEEYKKMIRENSK